MRLRAPAQLPLELGNPPAAPVLDRKKRGAQFLALNARTAVNSPVTTGMDFWTFNPYVGCEFGCSYCYARATHRWTTERTGSTTDPSLSPAEAFERDIFVKRNAAQVMVRSLDPVKLAGQPLLIGTATDPYQPAERQFEITRGVLETLSGYSGLDVWITTKSPLVARDIDVMRRLAIRNKVTVSISIISLDGQIIRRLEPRSPMPHARIRALRALSEAGIRAGVLIAPILPGITDGWAALGALMAAAKEAGARFAVGSALRLAPVARDGFLPVLEREFPDLVERYRRRYRGRHGAGTDYLAALDRRVRALQRVNGFPVESIRYYEAREPERAAAR